MIAFDDGPLETTGPILDALAQRGVRAAFFVVGERITGNEDLLERMVAEGHEIGNHGWSHRAMDVMELDVLADKIAVTHRAIVEACGVAPSRFRPPFRRLAGPGLRLAEEIYGRVELESSIGDYRMTAVEIVEMAALVPPGRTIWLHDGHWPTVEALPTILAHRAALEAVAA